MSSVSTGRSIGHRLTGVLSLVLLITFIGSGFGYVALQRVADQTANMYQGSLLSLIHI